MTSSASALITRPLIGAAAQPSRRDEPPRPRATAHRAAPSRSTRAQSRVRARTQRTVLVVDDSVDTREMYGSYLGHRGFGVLMAPDGDAAVEIALAKRPDI